MGIMAGTHLDETGAVHERPVLVDQYGNALVNLLPVAGERGAGSINGADHLATVNEWKSETLVVAGTGDLLVRSGPVVLRCVRVRNTDATGTAVSNTAGIILVKDGSVVKDGAAAGKTPGSMVYDGMGGIVFATSVVVNFANVLDTLKIEVLYRPLPTAAAGWIA